MIESVHIEGFQSLADVELPLGRFTVIQGRSNSGKSAVIRALRAVVTNGGNMRGTGHSFIRQGSKSCRVEIRRDTGTVVWSKSPKTTTYNLDGKKFTTGMEVPGEVAEFLRMGDIVIDDANNLRLNVNFQGGARGQGQFEPPFLIVDRPGSYLAKVFALLTSANVLYEAQAVAKKDARAKSGRLKTLRELAEAEQSRYVEVKAEHEQLAVASAKATVLWESVQSLQHERDRLVALDSALRQGAADLAACEEQLARMGAVDESMLAPAEESLAALASLHAWSTQMASIDAEMTALSQSSVPALPDNIEAHLAQAEGLLTQSSALKEHVKALTASASALAAASATVADEATAQEQAEKELAALVHEMGTCPTCNQVMDAKLVTA